MEIAGQPAVEDPRARPTSLPEPDDRESERSRAALVTAGAVAILAFLVYLVTLSGGVLGGDAGELQFVPPILGLTHPTGYPLQVLVHFAWSHLPIGTVAYRLNLLDAGIAALAVATVVLLTRRLGASLVPSAAAGLALAFGELWWSQAVRGDKYTLNGLFLAMTLLLFFHWRRRPSDGRLGLLAFVYGLSLTHHRGMLLVAPALAVGLVLTGWGPDSLRMVARLAVLVLAPLLLYAYVPWAGSRGLPPGAWPVDTPGAFVEYLLDRGYTSQIRPDAAFRGRLVEELQVLVRSFGPLGVLLGLGGLGVQLRRDWLAALVLLLAFVPQSILGASYLLESNYEIPRHWVFFLPGFLIWAVWIGLGVSAVVQWVCERRGFLPLSRLRGMGPWGGRVAEGPHGRHPQGRPSGGAGRPLVYGVLGLFLVVQAGTAWARGALPLVRAEAGAETMDGWRQDFQRSPVAERFGRLAFDLAEADSTIVCDWEQATVLWYLQRVERQRPDLTIRYPIESLDEALAQAAPTGRAVYVSRTLPGVEAKGVISSVGPLLRVSPPPDATLPPPATPVGERLEGGLTLAGVTIHARSLAAGSVLPLTLDWRADAPLADDYAVSVRLVGPDGAVLAQQDERHPALGTSPTSRWRPGQVVGDYHELPIGSRVPPGSYHVEVVAYRVEPHQELRLLDAQGQPADAGVKLPSFEVAPRQAARPLDLLVRLLAR